MAATAFALDKYVSVLPIAASVYDTPTADGKVIGQIAPKAEVQVYVVNGDWAIVDYQGQVGYVATACLKKVETDTQTAAPQPSVEPQRTTQQPAQTTAQPKQQGQPKTQQQQPAANSEPASKPKSSQNEAFTLYDKSENYSLFNNKDNTSDLFDCGGTMYFEFGYQRPTYTNPHQEDDWAGVPWTTPFSLNGGMFSMGGIIPVWGPIGLDLGFGMDITYGKYKTDDFYYDVIHGDYGTPRSFGDQYDYASRFRLTMPFYLMPVFGLNVGYKHYVRLHTGPRFALYFLDQVDFHYVDENGKKQSSAYEFYGIGEDDNVQRVFDITWYLGISYSYKSIGVRVAYEWGLIGRYKNEYYNVGLDRKQLYDPRYNNLIISLFVPIYF